MCVCVSGCLGGMCVCVCANERRQRHDEKLCLMKQISFDLGFVNTFSIMKKIESKPKTKNIYIYKLIQR